ncbi:MAG: 50S ribosomal protein L21 [Acidobacteriota bacterium]|nr:50S ribosomal protein L21 [Acidobacteriota bacterium]
MYAIVKSGGKQYRVEPGQRLLVERLSADVGATVKLEPLLYRSEEALFDEAALKGVTVSARVIAHERGEKVRIFKYKPKRGYRRRAGHRQELTRIEVGEIKSASRARGATAKAAAAGEGTDGAGAPPAAAKRAVPARPRTPAKDKEAKDGA